MNIQVEISINGKKLDNDVICDNFVSTDEYLSLYFHDNDNHGVIFIDNAKVTMAFAADLELDNCEEVRKIISDFQESNKHASLV